MCVQALRSGMDEKMADTSGEYTEEHLICHAIVWGEGWMSPGGDGEVASVVEGIDLSGRTILDIGSGLGGPSVALAANHGAGKIVSIDVQAEQAERSRQLATKRGVSDRITYEIVEPGPFPFVGASFDVVFSMGAFSKSRISRRSLPTFSAYSGREGRLQPTIGCAETTVRSQQRW